MEHRPVQQRASDEIDLGELLLAIWNGKWLIAGITLVCAVLAVIYLKFSPKTFVAQLEVRPLTSFDAEAYTFFNRLDGMTITPAVLISLLGERLATREDIIRVADQYQLVDRSEFDDDSEYQVGLRQYAESLSIKGPGTGSNDDESRLLQIRIEGPNKEATTNAFREALNNANEFVRQTLESRIRTYIAQETQLRDFKIEDLARRIEGTRIDYDRNAERRSAFLAEQAEIARQVGVAQPVMEDQATVASSSVNIGIVQDAPYYLFGYQAIEKELDLIQQRDNKDAFIPQLVELKREKRELQEDPRLGRMLLAFETTPVTSSEHFKTGHWNLSQRDLKHKTSPVLVLALAIVLGGMLGLFALLIKNVVTSSRRVVTNP